jgi:hypothetical protein
VIGSPTAGTTSQATLRPFSPQKVRKTFSFDRKPPLPVNRETAGEVPDLTPVNQGQTPRKRSASTWDAQRRPPIAG